MRVALFLLLASAGCSSPRAQSGGPDEVIVLRTGPPADVWIERARRYPFLAESVGYALLDADRPAEARSWFERAHPLADSARATDGLEGDGRLAGYLVRTAWLAHGVEVARAEIESMPPELPSAPDLRLPVCFVRHGELPWMIDVVWRGEAVEEVGPTREIVRTGPNSYGEKPTPLDQCLMAI